MKLNQLIKAGLVAVSVMTLTACGFGLRGVGNTGVQLAPHHTQVALITDNDAVAFALKPKLSTQLAQLGITTDDTASQHIKISNLRYREYKLFGVLTEIRLVLTADVSYQLTDQTHTHTVQVERSYQYNQASVATSDQQGEQAKIWLQNSLAHRIAEQYYTLGRVQNP